MNAAWFGVEMTIARPFWTYSPRRVMGNMANY